MYLYIHIPYCISKCDYCDFFSVPCERIVPCEQIVPGEYLSALIREIKYKAAVHHVSRWDSVYIGGGTPSLLSVRQLDELCEAVETAAPIDEKAECTIEMNPETVTDEKLLAVQSHFVNRLSLGVQSLSDGALQQVHRHCSAERALEAIDLVKKYWKGDFSFDVIAGLPGQTQDEYITTLQRLVSFSPSHMSLYTLTVEDGTPFAKRIGGADRWDGDEADRLWLLGRDVLEEKGYMQYEVSNFALPGKQSRHNTAYWKQYDYIGCGASACGTIYHSGSKQGERCTNTTDLKAYCSFWNDTQHGEIPQEKELLSLRTEEFEYLMMGLRMLEGVNETEYKKRFAGVAPWFGSLSSRLSIREGVWAEYITKKFARVYKNVQGENCYSLTRQGILFLNDLLVRLE